MYLSTSQSNATAENAIRIGKHDIFQKNVLNGDKIVVQGASDDETTAAETDVSITEEPWPKPQ